MKEQLQDWGRAILWAAAILLVLFYFCWPVRVMGSSMEPTLNDGEIVLMSRFAAMTGGYEKGDIVLFDYADADGRHTVVKRVIATGGDTIRIVADGVEVNGVLLAETYAAEQTDGLVDMTVPEDSVFVLGDHRSISYDSRNMGAVSCGELQGKVFFRLYPLGAAGRL